MRGSARSAARSARSAIDYRTSAARFRASSSAPRAPPAPAPPRSPLSAPPRPAHVLRWPRGRHDRGFPRLISAAGSFLLGPSPPGRCLDDPGHGARRRGPRECARRATVPIVKVLSSASLKLECLLAVYIQSRPGVCHIHPSQRNREGPKSC